MLVLQTNETEWKNGNYDVPSMRSQCPVSTQMHTIETANEKLNSSAAVKRPQNPNDIRLPSEHGRMIYWHMGSSKNANATVAIIAVHTANNICIESKKKNITNSDTDAPSGRQSACIVSNVANLSGMKKEQTNKMVKIQNWKIHKCVIRKTNKHIKCYLLGRIEKG